MSLFAEECPIVSADNLGIQRLKSLKNGKNELLGQYFTPAEIAAYMASLLETPLSKNIKLLDPGAGGGVLTSAVVKELGCREGCPRTISAFLYEIDPGLIETLEQSMENLKAWASKRKIKFDYKIVNKDFVISNARVLTSYESSLDNEKYDIVISNPPYLKISKKDPRAVACQSIVYGQPNIYSLFMAVSAGCLKHDGQFIFITPRSFASGNYFRAFRQYLFSRISLQRFHLFESRTSAFGRDRVLQENVIVFGRKAPPEQNSAVKITISNGAADIKKARSIVVSRSELIDFSDVLYLPSSTRDLKILKYFRGWSGSLEKYGLKISTGPVVPFRAKEFLKKIKATDSVPLLWIQNVGPMKISFPLDKFRKEQWIMDDDKSRKLLVRNKNMILMRRFSPKEDFRRLTVAPYIARQIKSDFLGLENHLNYIYKPEGIFEANLACGLASFLSSKLFDAYFRIINGNTQVSATELRSATLPSLVKLEEIGRIVSKMRTISYEEIDTAVCEVLDIELSDEEIN